MSSERATRRRWEASKFPNPEGFHYVIDSAGYIMAVCHAFDSHHLIAAAVNAWDDPQALRERIKELEADHAYHPQGSRAMLAKARGEIHPAEKT